MIDRCQICKEALYEWRQPHRCAPRWECVMKDYDDEQEPVACFSNHSEAEFVAEQFAAQRFSGEGSEWEIWVRKDETQEWKKFNVTVEAVPSFTANPL